MIETERLTKKKPKQRVEKAIPMAPPVNSDDAGWYGSYIPHFKNANQFIKEKVEMLQDDFCIYLTQKEIDHLHTLKTENDINLAVRGIINKHWE